MKKPKLHVFNISHYCEKARWALDYCGIDYEVNIVSPISHLGNAKRLGLKFASLPILELESDVIQGSDKIIDWAEAHKTGRGSLAYRTDQAKELELSLDAVLGVDVRKWFYSEALVDHPKLVLSIFSKGLPLKERWLLKLAWPKVRSVMINKMDLGHAQGELARQSVERELTKLDAQLWDGTFGAQFSRTELTAASLLAPLALPHQHPMAGQISLPPNLKQQMEEWQERPALKWLVETYATFRC